MKQIFWILMIVFVAIFGLVWHTHRAKTRAFNSGAVDVRNQAAGNSRPRPPPEARPPSPPHPPPPTRPPHPPPPR